MEQTQANAPGQPQAQEPVHPIHEENAILDSLTKWVSENPDNDPHEGTDLEEPKPQEKESRDTKDTKDSKDSKEQEKDSQSDEPENQETQDQESVEIPEDDPIFEIEYKTDNGKESKKLSLKELREGYLAKQDYHRNIQKVKQQEAQLNEQMRQAEMKAAQSYVQQLESYKQAVIRTAVPELQNVDWNRLANDDPAEFVRASHRANQITQTLQAIEQEQKAQVEKMEGERRKKLAEAVETSRATLQREIPGWSQDLYQKLLKSGIEDYGFEPDMVSNVVDPRFFKVLHDASQYRQLQKAKPQVEKRVVSVPKVVKPGSVEKPAKSDAEAEAAKRLKKSGKGEDFVDWYLNKNRR